VASLKIADLEALEIISRLPDDIFLTVEEAAIFVRMSPSTLNKMRMPSHPTKGPVYVQADGKGANQKVLYKKADLKIWLENNRIEDTLAASVRKGQFSAFSTLESIVEPAPFWRKEGLLAGLVFGSQEDQFFERIKRWEVVWLSPADAASAGWASHSEHMALAVQIKEVLKASLGKIDAGLETSKLETLPLGK
jgi:hypothetical protein